LTILIVDDVATDGLLLSALMATQGHEVITVECPLAGLQSAVSQDPCLIVVDYMMPGLNGIEFIRKLRTFDRQLYTPVIMVTGSDVSALRLPALNAGATECLVKPVDPLEWRARTRNLIQMSDARRATLERAVVLAEQMAAASATMCEQESEIILRLLRASEARDPETAEHIKRSASLAQDIARRIGFEDSYCSRMYLAMQLHDVGKLGVPDAILTKPGLLSPAERSIMERHVVYGGEILRDSNSEVVRLGSEIALTHHERWDGSGYPNGLCGTDIPVSGRIAAVADVFDALTSWRPYKEPWSPEEALAHLRHEAGRLFDAVCVSALAESLGPAIGPSPRPKPTD